MRLSLQIRSEDEMLALGKRLGRELRPGDFVALVGDLGAGKTVLVRGVAKGAGVPDREVASPSFAIVYPYRGRIPIFHADLYRLSDYDELYATGFFDLVGGEGAVLVEWADRIPEAAPTDHLAVRIEVSSPTERQVIFEAKGARSEELLIGLRAAEAKKERAARKRRTTSSGKGSR